LAIGATVDRQFGEPAGPVKLTRVDDDAQDPLLAGIPKEFMAFTGHKEAVSSLPDLDSVINLVESANAPFQLLRVGENVYATQFHPELDVPGMLSRMEIYFDFGYWSPDAYEQTIATVANADVRFPHRILANFVNRYSRR
jgi:GMP synthase (glutamine-hydrolysing)